MHVENRFGRLSHTCCVCLRDIWGRGGFQRSSAEICHLARWVRADINHSSTLNAILFSPPSHQLCPDLSLSLHQRHLFLQYLLSERVPPRHSEICSTSLSRLKHWKRGKLSCLPCPSRNQVSIMSADIVGWLACPCAVLFYLPLGSL